MKTIILSIFTLFVMVSCNSNEATEATQEDTTDTTAQAVEEKPIEAETPKKQLRHVVMFKFKDTAAEEDVKSVEDAFTALPGKIPEIKGYEWGINNSPEGLNKGLTHCFFVTFDSEEGRATYLPHPDHKAFVEILEPHLEDVLVLDYWTTE